MKYNVLTIGRESGSGGRLIARDLAEELGIPFFDKRTIAHTAKEHGLDDTARATSDSAPTASFLYNLYFAKEGLSQTDQVFLTESRVIQRVAAEGPCVIVGRCADYVLRERRDVLRLFIHAPLPDRLRRLREDYGILEPNMEDYVYKQDKRRASYYEYFTGNAWGDARNYDLTMSSTLGLGEVVRIVTSAMRGA